MIDLSPKKQFQTSKEDVEAFLNVMSQPVIRKVITGAMAQMAYEAKTSQEMQGAKSFIEIFTQFGDEIKKAQSMPVRALTMDEPPQQEK